MLMIQRKLRQNGHALPAATRLLLVGALTVLIVKMIAPTPAQAFTATPLIDPTLDANDSVGFGVAIDGTTGLFGAPRDDDRGANAGAVYVVDLITRQTLRKITVASGQSGDFLGASVAAANGMVLAGARGDEGNGPFAGAAFLFDAATGAQLERLEAADGDSYDSFGFSVGFDGAHAIVGAPVDEAVGFAAGSAYIFNTAGTQLHKLTAATPDPYASFGHAVDIAGSYAIVGAPEDDGAAAGAGAAYIYDTTTGAELYKLTAADAAAYDQFGFSVAIDGNLALVGAIGADEPGSGSGAAYLFDVTTGTQLAKLTPGDPASLDQFGYSVGLSGNRIIIGAPNDDDAGLSSGSVYVFDAVTATQTEKVTAPDAAAGDIFGWSVGVVGDGVVVGAPDKDSTASDAGRAYVFGEGPGDVNGDFLVNVDDIDALQLDLRTSSGNPRADVNSDGLIDSLDFDVLVSSILQLLPGDSDGDYDIDNDDIALILSASKFGNGDTNALWSEGDYNNDARVNNDDIIAILATNQFGQGSYAALASPANALTVTSNVPEPAAALALLALGASALFRRQLVRL